MLPTQVKLEAFSAEMFEPLVGQTLAFQADGHPELPPAHMQLLEVKRGRKSPLFAREPFSLLFSLKDQPPLAECLYGLDNPQFEPAGLLISRVRVPKYERSDPEGQYYEAVFS